MNMSFKACLMAHVLALACTAAPPADTESWTPPATLTTATTTTGDPTTGATTDSPAYECGDLPGDPIELVTSSLTVCARRGCALQCWGRDNHRQLGHARATSDCEDCTGDGCCLGDDEVPAAWGDVDVGEPVLQVTTGGRHTCVLLSGGRVRCWGENDSGQLGLGHVVRTPIGSPPAARPDVKLGAPAIAVAAGYAHTCAILEGGAVRCWGAGAAGRLGRGDVDSLGDDELPDSAGDLDLGGPALAIAAADDHTCAILSNSGALRCWGDNTAGQLGYGHTSPIGDDESPADAGDVPVGAPVVQIALNYRRTCVVTDTGGVRCWGEQPTGHPHPGLDCFKCSEDPICCLGDDEPPQQRGDLDLGGPALSVSVGAHHTCAVLAGGALRCWGSGKFGLLGPAAAGCNGCDESADCCLGDDEPPAAGTPLSLAASVTAVAAGDGITCAVLTTGAIRCWGRNRVGLLGHANTPQPFCSSCEQPTCCLGDDESIDAGGDVHVFELP